jgi:hypothetical protein
MSSSIKVQKCGTQLCYSWTDKHGFHQYYTEMLNFSHNVGTIKDFQTKKTEKYIEYSWNDNNGFHSYSEIF